MFAKCKIEKKKGFSSIEILVSLVIFGLIVAAVGLFQRNVFKDNLSLHQNLTAQQEVRGALKRMVTEIRPAVTANTGAYTIAQADKDEFAFYSDADNDGLNEKIRFYLDGNQIKRAEIVPTGAPLSYDPLDEEYITLVNDIVNTDDEIFFYYDGTYTGTEDPLVDPVNISEIRLVRIYIAVNRTPERSPETIIDESQVIIRSLKDNF